MRKNAVRRCRKNAKLAYGEKDRDKKKEKKRKKKEKKK